MLTYAPLAGEWSPAGELELTGGRGELGVDGRGRAAAVDWLAPFVLRDCCARGASDTLDAVDTGDTGLSSSDGGIVAELGGRVATSTHSSDFCRLGVSAPSATVEFAARPRFLVVVLPNSSFLRFRWYCGSELY